MSSRNFLYIFIFPHETCSILIFSIRETCTFLIVKPVLFMEFVACLFLFVKLNLSSHFSSWNLPYIDFSFMKLNQSWYCSSWNLLHVGFFFVKHDASWFFFVKPTECRLFLQETYYIFSSWNLLHNDFSFRVTYKLFFLVKPLLLVEIVGSWFLFVKLNLFWYFSSWNLLYVGLFFH